MSMLVEQGWERIGSTLEIHGTHVPLLERAEMPLHTVALAAAMNHRQQGGGRMKRGSRSSDLRSK
jgi:hypothetical protein